MSEHRLQVDLMSFLRQSAKPEIFYFAVPNGGLRNIRVAQKMKAEGLKPGVADICFMLPGGAAAWLELKIAGGRLSDHQIGFKTICEKLGHRWGVARSIDEAAAHLQEWGVLR